MPSGGTSVRRIRSAAVARKNAYAHQPFGPGGALRVGRLRCPLERQLGCNVGGFLYLHEGSEAFQTPFLMPHLEAEVPPHPNIVLRRLFEGFHRPPPDQRSANGRNAWTSTFA